MSSLLAHAVRAFALALLVAVPARAEDPQPAPPVPSAVPQRPASAFQAAKVFLDALDAFEKRQGGLGLTSLDAERKPPGKKRGELVRLEIWLAITTPDPKTGRRGADDLVRTLEGNPAVSEAHLFDDYRHAGPNGLAPERRLRLSITWDPAQAPERTVADKTYECHPETYIRIRAGMDKVEVGGIESESDRRPIAGTDWIDERLRIHPNNPEVFLSRLRIHNYALVLEHYHRYATITRIRMQPPTGQNAIDHPDLLWMELELSILEPPPPAPVPPPK